MQKFNSEKAVEFSKSEGEKKIVGLKKHNKFNPLPEYTKSTDVHVSETLKIFNKNTK